MPAGKPSQTGVAHAIDFATADRLPETEQACQAAWQKAAWPEGRR
jgi:hypothetical protein